MIVNKNKISFSISSLVVSSTLFLAALQLKIDQGYSDFVVGNIAWYAGNKFQDLVAWPVFIVFLLLAFSAFSKISSYLQETNGAEVSDDLNAQLVFWSLPFYAGLGSLFSGGEIDHWVAVISFLGIVSLGAIGFYRRKFSLKPDPSFWSATLLVGVLISFIPIELAILLSKFPIMWIGDIRSKVFVAASIVLLVLNFLLAIILLARQKEITAKSLSKLIFLAQIGLPVFFLTLYPSVIPQSTGEIYKYKNTIFLKLLVVSLVLYSVYDVVRRFRLSLVNLSWHRCFSPFALFALIVVLRFGQTLPPNISPDDYHFGEQLLGWWSYVNGYVPYVDYVPAHGLIDDDLNSFLSFVLYDGTAASIGEANRIAFALLGLFAFISMYRFTGSLVLAFSIILLLGGRLSWFFFAPFVCLWLATTLRAQPGNWLSIWVLTAPILILGVPPQGVLLVGAFGLLAIKIAWDQIQFGDKKSWHRLGVVAGFVLLVFATTPIFSMLVGAINYVIVNGPINQVAYGLPWNISWNQGAKSGFVFEAIRMSWVAIAVLSLCIVRSKYKDIQDSKSSFYPALVFLIFLVLLVPYSMGRIDPGATSRPGLVSIFGWAIIFPLLMWEISNKVNRVFLVLCAVFFSALLGYGKASFSGISMIAKEKVNTPSLRDFGMIGLPNVGHAYMEEIQWNRIDVLNKILKKNLNDDETYLDLTSRNANYFYLNRLPPVPITAVYNNVPIAQQEITLNILKRNPPKIALLSADNIIHDGGGLALRSPLLYKFVIENYVPKFEDGYITATLKKDSNLQSYSYAVAQINPITDKNWSKGLGRDQAALVLADNELVSMLKVGDKVHINDYDSRSITRVWSEGSAIWLDGKPVTSEKSPSEIGITLDPNRRREYFSSLFDRSFSVSDYKKIPVSWGKSEKQLKQKMVLVAAFDELKPQLNDLVKADGIYRINGPDPYLYYDTSTLKLSGKQAGLLRFEFSCLSRVEDPRIQVFWWGDNRTEPFERSSVRFTADDGTLIAPLDSSARWISLDLVRGIRVDLENSIACKAISVKNVQLYQRLPVMSNVVPK